MDTRSFIAKAYDANAFTTAQASAGYINPEIWNKEVLMALENNLVLANLGKKYDDLLMKEGDTLNITVGVTPASGSTVAESSAISVAAYSKTQVVFTPSERGLAYQLTNKEKDRSFINLMQDMTSELGYSLAVEKDTKCKAILYAGFGNSIISNGVVSSAIASSDTIDYDDIVNASTAIRQDHLIPKYLVVGDEQYGDLLKLAAFRDASQFNGEVAKTGFLGKVAGLEVYSTDAIIGSSNVIKAIVLGVDKKGVPSFGIAQKRNPYIETEYHALERYTDIVAVEDYDAKVLRANGICLISSYSAI